MTAAFAKSAPLPVLRNVAGEPPLGTGGLFFRDDQGEMFCHPSESYRTPATRIGILELEDGQWLALPPSFHIERPKYQSREKALRAAIASMVRKARRYMRNAEGEGTHWNPGFAGRVIEWALSLKCEKIPNHLAAADDAGASGHPGSDGAVITDPIVAELVAAHRLRKIFPAGHTFAMTWQTINGSRRSVGTCTCGDVFSYPFEASYQRMDAAIEAHWQKFDHLADKVDGRGEPIQGSDGRTDEAKARKVRAAGGSRKAKTTEARTETGVGSERSSPSDSKTEHDATRHPASSEPAPPLSPSGGAGEELSPMLRAAMDLAWRDEAIIVREPGPVEQDQLHDKIRLYSGSCIDALPLLAENSLDCCVVDPPYHLTSKSGHGGFMGKAWDGGNVAFDVETWRAVLRVLKPGGFVVAFSGTRTYHRMVCAIEDAGFEIRDMIQWLYGSGFPKSHDVSKGIDKAAGATREVVGRRPDSVASVSWREAEGRVDRLPESSLNITAPATPAARQWEGWGTALKPANEPIVLARKPLSEKTVAANVLKWGTGAINIDGCLVGTDDTRKVKRGGKNDFPNEDDAWTPKSVTVGSECGRWPANIIHDGSEEVLAAFADAPGQQRGVGPQNGAKDSINVYGDYGPRNQFDPRGDSGSAARFFYTAKADSDDRLGSKHPTVKPVDLMQWLCRLVTPPGGTVLDCFAGTGTTGEAAFREGFKAILIEREAEYQDDIRRRVRLMLAGPEERSREIIKQKLKDQPLDAGPLFGGSDKSEGGGDECGEPLPDLAEIEPS